MLGALLFACGPGPPGRPIDCHDVGEITACFSATGAPRVVPRALPGSRPIGGWRCWGDGDDRGCVPRRSLASPLECDDAQRACAQRHPFLPDHDVWECRDDDGIAICRRRARAAGTSEASTHPAWVCAPRRGEPDELLCVDGSPDVPDGEGWRCFYAHEAGERRRCQRDREASTVGGACGRGCPDGARCVAGRCVPSSLEPECWLDEDCDDARCRFARCDEGA